MNGRTTPLPVDAGRLKHLEMIQQVIARMASNSFLIKGWSLTLVSAILAIALKDSVIEVLRVALIPTLLFWILDGYFLRQERLFRKLFDHYRASPGEPTDFSMDTSPYTSKVDSWPSTIFSKTLRIFHGALVIVLLILVAITWKKLWGGA